MSCVTTCALNGSMPLLFNFIYDYFMLNSAEHEISNAHEYRNIKKFSFSGSISVSPHICFILVLILISMFLR